MIVKLRVNGRNRNLSAAVSKTRLCSPEAGHYCGNRKTLQKPRNCAVNST